MELGHLTIESVKSGLVAKDYSAEELAASFLKSIEQSDKHFGAYLRTRPEVLAEARAVDQHLATGLPSRLLEGVPVAVKDNMLIQGEVTTAASKILENYRGVYSATVVDKLRAQGALILGKTNLDEFAMGASTENSAWQITRNPWNPAVVPGGSSGGSAAAVAAGLAVVGLGSDTGGSIRQPAGFCNVVGFKPTYGRVSRYGLIALASSLDQIGPFARNIEDAALVYQAISGGDDNDGTSQSREVGQILADMKQPIKNLRIGLPKEFFAAGTDPEVAAIIKTAAKKFTELGAEVIEVSLAHLPQALPTYYIIQPAEASSNLARYDGIHYGLSARPAKSLETLYRQTRATGFGAEVKRRIIIGTYVLSAGYADAYYHQANRVRAILREEFNQVFDQVDVLLGPTSPTLPFPIGARTADPLTMYLADLFTVPANLARIPAMSIPAGFVNDLPVGLQLMAAEWQEVNIFKAAYAYQQVTDWHLRRPPAV